MLDMIIEPRKALIGPGLEVKRILPYRLRRMVGPFIFMDHAGPVPPANSNDKFDVLPHPHIGLSTITYLLGGAVTHRDSLGTEQVIVPGEVNWMTAGKGIAHSERFEDEAALKSGKLEMIQTWVALPEEKEECDPSFSNYRINQLPVMEEDKVWMRLIAGNAYGMQSEVQTASPLFYLHVVMARGAKLYLPPQYPEKGVYIVSGRIETGINSFTGGQMLVFNGLQDNTITALRDSTLLILGGEPLGNRFIWWNFVSSRKERIDQAKADWQEGRIALPPNDNKVFIPLPEEGPARPEPLS